MYKSYSINCLNLGLDFIYDVLKINGAWDVSHLWMAYKIIVTAELSYASGSAFYLVILIKIYFRLVSTLVSQVEVTFVKLW